MICNCMTHRLKLFLKFIAIAREEFVCCESKEKADEMYANE